MNENPVVVLLLCDLDDTLVSRRSMFARWAAAYLAELGAPHDDVSWLVKMDDDGHRPREDFFRPVIDRYELSETVESLAERYHRDYISSFRCEAEVVSALEKARKIGYKLAIVTNGDVRSQAANIAATGVGDLVDAHCIAEAKGCWKPAPELFRIAAERCGCTFEKAWMIGDNPVADIGGAMACGARTVWIRMGRVWPHDLSYQPDFAVDTFQEGVDLVLQRAAAEGLLTDL